MSDQAPVSTSPAASSTSTPAASTPASTPASGNAPSSGSTPSSGTNVSNDKGNVSDGGSTANERRYKITVDKQEKELTEAELIRQAQKGYGSEKRFAEAAAKEKIFANFELALQKNPKAAIKALAQKYEIGIDELGFEFLDEHLTQREQDALRAEMSPEELELEEYREEKKTRAQKEAEAKQAAERETYETNKFNSYNQFVNEVQTALDTVSFLRGNTPAHDRLTDVAMGDAAEFIGYCHENQLDWDYQDIAEAVKQRHQERIDVLLGIDDDKLMAEFLPKDFVKRVGKYYYNQLTAKTEPKVTVAANQPSASSRNEVKKPKLWSDYIREKNERK